jgi:hypothetical protein
VTTAKFIIGSLGGVVIICQFICIGIALYLSYTKGDLMSSHFKNSSSLLTFGIYRRTSLYGRLQLVGNISSILTFPGFFIKRGLANAEDIDSFPLPLKRQLVMLQWGFIGLVVAMVLLVAIGKSGILK